MVKHFTFDDINSISNGVKLIEVSTLNKPKKRYSSYDVLGKNGSVKISYNCFENVSVTYKCISSFENYERFTENLSKKDGYFKLEDNIHSGFVRYGFFVSAEIVNTYYRDEKVVFTISFDCKPQKFLTTGFEEKEITSGTNFNNTSNYECFPIVRIYGYGTVTIGSLTITVTDYYNYIEIDGETLKFDKDGAINKVSFNVYQQIKLAPGNTRISYSLTEHSEGSGAKVVIIPRWYRI